MKIDWIIWIAPKKYFTEEFLQKWMMLFRLRVTFYGPDLNLFGKDLFETYLKD